MSMNDIFGLPREYLLTLIKTKNYLTSVNYAALFSMKINS